MDTHPTIRRPFRLVFALLIAGGIMLLFAACAPTSIGPGGQQGTLTGDVVAGPTCPVQGETPCPPAPVTDRQVTIKTSSGAVAATATTDAQGHFSVSLAPGSYDVQVAIIPGQIGMRQTTPGQVTIVSGQTTHLQIELDTGIR